MATLFKRYHKKDSYTWYVSYMDQGKSRMKSTGTKNLKLAEKVKQRIEEDILRVKKGLEPKEQIEPTLLSEFASVYLANRRKIGKAERTIQTDEYSLRRLLDYTGDCSLLSITQKVAQAYKEYKLERVNNTSASIEFRSIRAAFNWALEKPGTKYLYYNPFAQKHLIPSAKKSEYPLCLSPEEKSQFLETIGLQEHKNLFKFYLLTGCRRSEALRLEWEDVDFEGRRITFRQTKTKKDRTIPMNIELMQIINALDRTRTRPFEYSPSWVSHLFRKYLKKSGIQKEFHLHCLRHTAASDMVRQNIHLSKIAKLLGHSSTRTTEIYTHVVVEDLREAAEALTCIG
ncbi:tyrosine-type recombinase/integrase [bacterium]|nr:tyrosine-type recombinase/integrase [bacterium]MBU1651260.1 tyrosine-type recombinase/integrase [bacterium]MBU1882596.1 tyrosine-type recombinase/integrase [bacterium]